LIDYEKPSIAVAPTTLWMVLLIYSFQFTSAFSAFCQIGFSSFILSFSPKKRNIFAPVIIGLNLNGSRSFSLTVVV